MEVHEGVSPQTIFRIFSMTKPITSVAVLMLVEEGRLRLSDPVHLYVPSFHKERMHAMKEGSYVAVQETEAGVKCDRADAVQLLGSSYEKESVKNNITIEHLLTHTSGLSHGIDTMGIFCPVDAVYAAQGVAPQPCKSLAGDLSSFVDLLAKQPLVAQPGTLWHYSSAPDVLGRVVEVVSGQRRYSGHRPERDRDVLRRA